MHFLLQMHGAPGSGKSTLALEVGRRTGAVVLDKDRIKAPLMDAQDDAGPLAYDVLFGLADDLLAQGHAVVLDSPAYWPAVVERGRALAERHAVAFALVEVRCLDRAVLDHRLRTRSRLRSQPASLAEVDAAVVRPGTRAPTPSLRVDGTSAVELGAREVIDHLAALGGQPPRSARSGRGRTGRSPSGRS